MEKPQRLMKFMLHRSMMAGASLILVMAFLLFGIPFSGFNGYIAEGSRDLNMLLDRSASLAAANAQRHLEAIGRETRKFHEALQADPDVSALAKPNGIGDGKRRTAVTDRMAYFSKTQNIFESIAIRNASTGKPLAFFHSNERQPQPFSRPLNGAASWEIVLSGNTVDGVPVETVFSISNIAVAIHSSDFDFSGLTGIQTAFFAETASSHLFLVGGNMPAEEHVVWEDIILKSSPRKITTVENGKLKRYNAVWDKTESRDGMQVFVLSTVEITGRVNGAFALALWLVCGMALFVLLFLASMGLVIRKTVRSLDYLFIEISHFTGTSDAIVFDHKAPFEVEKIAFAFQVLAGVIKGWKAEQEHELGKKTRDIAMFAGLAKTLAGSVDDDTAYQSALSLIVGNLATDDGVFLFYDGAHQPFVVSTFSPSMIPVQEYEYMNLMNAINSPGSGFSYWGIEVAHSIGSLFMGSTEEVGAILIGRKTSDMNGFDADSFAMLVRELSPLLESRYHWHKSELARKRAEISLRSSETQLRSFFNESQDLIYSCNSHDILASINPAGLKLLGYGDLFEMVGRPFSSFTAIPETRTHFLKRILDESYVSDFEIAMKRSDGSIIYCLESAHAVRTIDGTILEIQGIQKDITERVNHDINLFKMNAELSDANEKLKTTQSIMVQQEKLASIGQLAAGIAHEINNPLGFLRGNHSALENFWKSIRSALEELAAITPEKFNEIREKYDLDFALEEGSAALAESEDGYRRIIEIISNLKNFAKLGASSAQAPYNLNDGIDSTLIIAANELKYVVDIEKQYGDIPNFPADGGAIDQVILNILVNSANAIEGQKRQEKGKILIETGVKTGSAFVKITDDGPGIPESIRTRIFDPFFTTKEPGKGTGLGLSISYDIVVNKHGGTISVESKEGEGASFLVTLPLKRESQDTVSSGNDQDETPT